MSEFTSLKINSNESLRVSDVKTFIKWLIAISLLVLLVCFVAAASWIGDSRRFSAVDHGADSLKTGDFSPEAGSDDSSVELQRTAETTYQNSRSGVSIKLPGTWRNADGSSITTPDLRRRFCVLASQDHVFLLFWPEVPDFNYSLEADARSMLVRFRGAGFRLKSQGTMSVRGRDAALLRFRKANVDLNLLLIRKGFTLFLVAISGSDMDPTWKQVEDSLPDSVEIR